MKIQIRLLRHIIVGNGGRARSYQAGDVIPAPMAEAIEWCLKRWAIPAHASAHSEPPRLMIAPISLRDGNPPPEAAVP